jgi:penicillin-binding protein 1B
VLAVLVDLRYGKREILEAYLNEIYLGASGRVSLMGVGAASWAYFGKEPFRLSLAESATLAGIIPAPARFDPLAHPEEAKRRRDLVLGRLAELEWVPQERIDAALAAPLVTDPQTLPRRRAPYFTDLAEKEAMARFSTGTLADRGFTLLSTLSARDQREAEEAVPWGLASLEKGWERGREGRSPLQAALVSIHSPSGGIRAYVGGRDYKGSQFDRAQARRQPGSAFKAVVYAAALRSGAVNPATIVEDTPLIMRVGGSQWAPENSDREFRGWVSVRDALEDSLNVPTVRVAMRTGLEQIVALAEAMGAQGELQPVPAVALGAFEMTSLELATVYATLANGGVRPPVHALEGVLDGSGTPVAGGPLPPGQRVLEPEVAYVVTRMLQGAAVSGTGAGVRRFLADGVATKTGTSNDAKDSWLAGYTPDRTTVVWVGYDENLPTRLSGSRGALPIWGKFTAAVRPPAGFPEFTRPDGVVELLVDPTTGQLATDRCHEVREEVFVERFAPRRVCERHTGWFSDPLAQGNAWEAWPDRRQGRAGRPGGLRGWLDRVFGEGEEGEQPPPEQPAEEPPPPADPDNPI